MDVLIVFLPLVGAILAGLFGKLLGDRGSQVVTCSLLIAAAVLSVFVFFDVGLHGHARTTQLFTWFDSGTFELNWALRVDTLTAVMFCVVTIVSAVVHVYSVGYMAEDRSIPRFQSYLSLFTFFMLMLVSSDNLVQMFFGWEGVGLASYLLIGFWYEKPSACAAAIKAFLVNRVGDVGFALGIAGIFLLFGAVDYDTIFQAVPGQADTVLHVFGRDWHALTVLCLLLFLGAMGKSAQLGLHTWLPDAMEGPTPVSALIHAATMVTAGVFMVCRLSPIFEYAPDALTVVTIVGASTAFFAATVGLTQNDIKRVIAYSTCSQLGYMFFAAGVSAYGAAMFHLMTHAFFKALLFLGAGAVIHAMHHEQDMRKMGGLWRKIPVTYTLMWIGSLALCGFGIPGLDIGFAGFYSKDMIIEAAFAAHSGVGDYAYWLGVIAAFMTAFYSFRLLFMTFHGKTRADHHTFDHAHEAPKVMIWPLFVLATGAVLAGAVFYGLFVGEGQLAFWNGAVFSRSDVLEAAHHIPEWAKVLPMVMTLAGIGLAWLMYVRSPELAPKAAAAFRPLYLFSFRKWYFDELYDRIFVQPALYLGRGFWTTGDGAVIDGLGPDGVAAATRDIAQRASRLQSGYLYHYAFAMLIGVVVLVTWYIFSAL
ncbi:NADH dehydrogenase subunit L [Tistlia consotensis]|uniref:NADH-ubiquinone oxidoreductase chain 5 n=1 Tax=Tistlia consotensis USBA 355 TaxID=560819 RepID=A0A1Y6BS32_9PROT|nr:NADH-quinone oxidoreductase subunit L [Tistlia consotensis]SMF25142.1 NADH dehydrogenase subunit L [Tistlia consotensis USBA 355]SNR59971.1 NADH dehydrogenase subunit L [Tistlia consotensis]